MFLNDLVVNVPYGLEDGNPVVVPPIADSTSRPIIESISGTKKLTNADGTAVLADGQSPAGWDSSAELAVRNELAAQRNALQSMLGGSGGGIGGLATSSSLLVPEVRTGVQALLKIVDAKLARVSAIYQAWQGAMLPSEGGGVLPLPLRSAFQSSWNQVMFPADSVGPHLAPTFASLAQALGNERGGWDGTSRPSYTQLHDAIMAARTRDRKRIRTDLHESYRALYCSEYGLAQSESYLANKADWQAAHISGGLQLSAGKPPGDVDFGDWGDDEPEPADPLPTPTIPGQTAVPPTTNAWAFRARVAGTVAALGLTTFIAVGAYRRYAVQ